MGYSYTLGLPLHIGYPELVICGFGPRTAMNVVTAVVALLHETPVLEGRVAVPGRRAPLWVTPLPEETVASYLWGAGWWRREHHDSQSAAAKQVVLSDAKGRFPWEPGCEPGYGRIQSLLLSVDPSQNKTRTRSPDAGLPAYRRPPRRAPTTSLCSSWPQPVERMLRLCAALEQKSALAQCLGGVSHLIRAAVVMFAPGGLCEFEHIQLAFVFEEHRQDLCLQGQRALCSRGWRSVADDDMKDLRRLLVDCDASRAAASVSAPYRSLVTPTFLIARKE